MIDSRHTTLVDLLQPKYTDPLKAEIQFITEAIQRQLRKPELDLATVGMMVNQLTGFTKQMQRESARSPKNKTLMPIDQVLYLLMQHVVKVPLSRRVVTKTFLGLLVDSPFDDSGYSGIRGIAFSPEASKKPPMLKVVKSDPRKVEG